MILSLLKSKNRNSCLHLLKSLRVSYSQQTNAVDKAYKPALVEQKWYDLWQSKMKEFQKQHDRTVYSMIFPPPNVTGNLHLGHALTATIQDVIVRWKMMNKFRVVWIPGYDHAGIATQVVVEKKLWNEKKLTRHSIGREAFLEEVFKWKDLKKNVIKSQLLQMNALVDWDLEYFTMNETIKRSVNEAFIDLHKKKLVYRAFRPINWCCTLKSAISDAEVDNHPISKRTYLNVPGYEKPVEFGMIHSYDYPVADSDKFITVSTTRPETMFGDTAIAIHPEDTKYKDFHGKKCINPLTNETLDIILDSSVDPKFGTGAVKITPGHDTNDYEIGLRHNLPIKIIYDESGHLTNVPEEFLNMPRFTARYKVLEKLKSMNLWRSSTSHQMVLPICSRTGDVIEPFVKEQWFVNSSKVFKVCEESTSGSNKELQIIPKQKLNLWNHYVKSYTTKDWCISRQLWWGQRIPAYKCSFKEHSEWIAANSETEAQSLACNHFTALSSEPVKASDVTIQQDHDVFDTWFTSCLLPIAVFGWPFQKNESPSIYPTNMLETGYDIMFFWAFRMVGICHALTDKLPFGQILFHGLIRDSEGRKMSKSIGNVIDPNDLINGTSLAELNQRIHESNLSEKEKLISVKNQSKVHPNGIEPVGSDALRLALLVQDFKSESINLDMYLFTDSKRYCNKIWNAVNYFQLFHSDKQRNFKHLTLEQIVNNKKLRCLDSWILSKLMETAQQVNASFENEFDMHNSVKMLRAFYYANFFDFYLESTKPLSQSSDFELVELVWNVMRICNHEALLMYHPFMPSITEELWQTNSGFCDNQEFSSILDFDYPSYAKFKMIENLDLASANSVVNKFRQMVDTINSLKSINNMYRSKTEKASKSSVELFVCCSDDLLRNELEHLRSEIMHLTRADNISFTENRELLQDKKNNLLCKISDDCEISIVFKEKIEADFIIGKFNKDLLKVEKKINGIKSMMSRPKYEQVDSELKAKHQRELNDYLREIRQLNEQIMIFKACK